MAPPAFICFSSITQHHHDIALNIAYCLLTPKADPAIKRGVSADSAQPMWRSGMTSSGTLNHSLKLPYRVPAHCNETWPWLWDRRAANHYIMPGTPT